MRNYVIINGVNSLTKNGLAIKDLPPITKTMMRTLREEVDGRDGDTITELGYSAYDKSMTIGLFGTGYDIDDIIAFFNQSGTIVFSNEPDKFYNFKIIDQIDYNKLLKFKEATIRFHCQPFKYPLNEVPLVEEFQYVEATGSDVTLDNTAAGIFNKFDLLGNTEQAQYSGKNLYNDNFSDYTQPTNYRICPITLTQGQTYVLKGKKIGTNITGVVVAVVPSGNQYSDFSTTLKMAVDIQGYGHTLTFTPDDTWTSPKLAIYASDEATFNSIFANYEIQLEKGSTATSYEPYVGEIPSPNPEYPQDIHVVSGDNEINICGKNLLPFTNQDFTLNGIRYYVQNGELYLNGTSVGETYRTNPIFKTNFSFYLEAGTYTFKQSEASLTSKYLSTYNDNTQLAVLNNNNTSATFTLTEKTQVVLGFYVYQLTANNINLKLQLEKGSTATTYEPYQGKSYPINLGVENVLDMASVLDYWGLTDYTEENGTYTINTGAINEAYRNPYTLSLEPNTTYTFSLEKVNQNSTNLRFEILEDGTIVSQIFATGTGYNAYSFTTQSNKTYTLRANYSNSGLPYIFSKVQLEKGSKVNSFTPYGTTPIEMASITDSDTNVYKDYFEFDNDKWYKVANIGKKIFTGDNNLGWTQSISSITGLYAYWFLKVAVPNYNIKRNSYIKYTDYFTYAKQEWKQVTYPCLCENSGLDTSMIIFSGFDSSINTVDKWKAWLATHNTTMYYILEEKTRTEITDTTLIDQLEAIKNAISYKGQTNISQTNNDLPFILDLSALELNSDHLVINNIGNIYSKPTLDLEGTGIVDIYLNDIQMFEVDLTENNEIIINTDEMEAFNPDTGALANRQVTGEYDVFKLDPGENDLRFSGNLTKATVTNYERWL